MRHKHPAPSGPSMRETLDWLLTRERAREATELAAAPEAAHRVHSVRQRVDDFGQGDDGLALGCAELACQQFVHQLFRLAHVVGRVLTAVCVHGRTVEPDGIHQL